MVDRRIKAARFPATKSLDTFDFLAMPSVNKHLVMQLARCEYVDRRDNVILSSITPFNTCILVCSFVGNVSPFID